MINQRDQAEAVSPTVMAQRGSVENEARSGAVTRMDEDLIKISANLPASVVDILRQVAKLRGVTMTEVLRDAIKLEKFVTDTHRDGGKLLVEDKDKRIFQILDRSLL